MKYAMENYLQVVTPYISSELVSPEALSDLRALTKILPSFPFSILECRLKADQCRVDLEVGLFCTNFSLPEEFLIHPTWQELQQICQDCSDSDSLLYERVKDIWLEFDVDGQPSEVPVPCIFLALNQENISKPQEIIEIASRLVNYQISSIWESNLRLSIECLPATSYISYLGVMLSRPDQAQALRIVTSKIALEQLQDYLVQIGWTYPTNTLQSMIDNLSEFVDYVCLSFDVGESILPKIGLECYLSKQPKNENRWQLFLDYLVEKGLCSVAKKDAILAWSGFCQKASHPELWPENLTWGNTFLGSRAFSIFTRKISHIKIVYEQGNLVEAKVYLWFGHTWLDSGIIEQTLAASNKSE